MGKLDPAAIAAVREQAWPEVASPDELHDAMHRHGCDHRQEGASGGWTRASRR
jgi:ATP-dependent Lhr-like helicase